MAKINSDLFHVLENVRCGEDAKLESPIKFQFGPELNMKESATPVYHFITDVFKKGRSWKMKDDFNNEWTISNLNGLWQNALYFALLSMSDKRAKPVSYMLNL